MFQKILDFILPYAADLFVCLFAFFGVRVTLSPKKTKQEKAVIKKKNRLDRVKKRASKLSEKLTSCVEYIQSCPDNSEGSQNGDSTN